MTKEDVFNKLPSRAVIILSGIPGSGKSTFVDALTEHLGNPMTEDVQVCSADHFWVDEKTGKYEFNIHFMGTAHMFCYENFKYYTGLPVEKRPLYVVVDNTNVSNDEMEKYITQARKTGWDVIIISFQIDLETAYKRNIHNVPKEVVQRMYKRMLNRSKIDGTIEYTLDEGLV